MNDDNCHIAQRITYTQKKKTCPIKSYFVQSIHSDVNGFLL